MSLHRILQQCTDGGGAFASRTKIQWTGIALSRGVESRGHKCLMLSWCHGTLAVSSTHSFAG